jgi:DNA-binding response OmpR family regulator
VLLPKPSILLVDDDSAALDGFSQLLEMAGFAVATARDGVEALEKINSQSFDLMLLDIWLPRMTGLELLAQLPDQANHPRVIVMTGDDSQETLLQTLRNQAYQYVRKPIQPKQLMDLIRRTLAAPSDLPAIVVLSASPTWVEVLVPCARDVAERIRSYIRQLEVDLPREVRDTVGLVFRELLLDAMESRGHLDSNCRVRIAYLRAQRMLLYRISDASPSSSDLDATQPATGKQGVAGSGTAPHPEGEKRLRPGQVLALAQADELLFNEAGNEVVVVKYLD